MDTVGRGNQRLTEIQCNTMARLNPLGIWERWSCTDHLFRRMSHRALLFSGDNIMVSQTVELGGKCSTFQEFLFSYMEDHPYCLIAGCTVALTLYLLIPVEKPPCDLIR